MKKYTTLFFLLFLLPLHNMFAQFTAKEKRQIDSLKAVIESANHDSVVINAMVEWDNIIYISDPELDYTIFKKIDSIASLNLQKPLNKKENTFFLNAKARALNNFGIFYKNKGNYKKALSYYKKALNLSKKLNNKKRVSGIYGNMSMVYYYLGDEKKALEYQEKSLKIKKETGDIGGLANSYSVLGIIYSDQGNFAKSIESHTKSLKNYEKINDMEGISISLSNIGLVYESQKEYKKALEHYNKSIQIQEKIGFERGIANNFLNAGNIYTSLKNYDSATICLKKSFAIYRKMDNMHGVSLSFNGLGTIYMYKADYDSALYYYNEALKIKEESGEKKGIANTLINIASIIDLQGDTEKAIRLANRSLAISREINAAYEMEKVTEILYEFYKKTKQYTAALEMHENYVEVRDKNQNEENKTEIIRQEYKYAYEKQAAKDSVMNAEATKLKDARLAAEKSETAFRKQQAYFLLAGLALALFFGGFIFNRFRLTRKQKNIIEKQKFFLEIANEQLEEKTKEITDSIVYAKRIQLAILPPVNFVEKHLKDSFILYLPKDIVAGDFYWLEKVGDKVLFAVCDCTGHGVPGAMVSVICNNALNRAVKEYKLTDPGKILDKTREIVIAEFEKSEEDVKDGMDISLCSLSLKNYQMQWAGANSPIWILRHDKSSMEEIKPDKQPIGKYTGYKPFATHIIQLKPGDTIYIFSDGFQDQFGGEKSKKFKPEKMKELLISIRNEAPKNQKDRIKSTFDNWKGQLEQVDDVCIIGVRF